MGTKERTLIIQSQYAGVPIPERIKNAPFLDEVDTYYFNAYHELGTCRNYELGPIPWLAIRAWCEVNELDYDDYELVKDVCLQLDGLIIPEIVARMNKGANSGKSDKPQPTSL